MGKSRVKKKAQFIIKPGKGQLASDHKDLDPASILARIKAQLKDRRLAQEYGDREE